MKVSAATLEPYLWGEVCRGWHLVQTEGLSVIQERVPPGRGEVRHYHERARQFFYVLSGQATLELGEETFVLNPLEGLEVAPQIVHQLQNDGFEDLVFLVISAPRSHGDRVVV